MDQIAEHKQSSGGAAGRRERADRAQRAESTTAVLEARGLTKRYGDVLALSSLDLAIAPGEVFCMLGANGAGKTTTINLFLAFIAPTSGHAFVKGVDVGQAPLESKRHLAYIPEQVMLYGNLTGLENLDFFCALAGVHKDRAALRSHLAEAGLPEGAIDRRVSTYSKGMRQKVGIAVAIAKDAEALLLDEPTSGLDPKASNEFSELLLKLSARGVAVLMATHDLFRAKETGTRIGIMRQGRMVQMLNPREIGHSDLERAYLEHMKD
ncbi:ABC transporter ATP-binding protein [Sorangium sp. So ce429]